MPHITDGTQMSGTPERFQSAAILLRTDDHWVLQHRDDIPGIAQPGAVGLWGGRREEDDATALENALRELREESELNLSSRQLEKIAEISYKLGVVSLNGITETHQVEATLFLGHQDPIAPFRPKEGQAALFVPIPELFVPNPMAPLHTTAELDLMIGQLAQDRHPVYAKATGL